MMKLLGQPYPNSTGTGKSLLLCSIAGVFIFLFLLIFQPFNLSSQSSGVIMISALAFGTVTFVVTAFINNVLPVLVPGLFKEERWTVGKEILFDIFQTILIAVGNLVMFRILYGTALSAAFFLKVLWITASIGIFPFTALVLYKNNRLVKKNSDTAREMEDILKGEPEAENTVSTAATRPIATAKAISSTVILSAANEKTFLEVRPADILFMQSADNYTKVFFMEQDQSKMVLLRTTLKRMEELLAIYPAIFRCHRMYLVNLTRITHVSGNAQGLKLELQGTEDQVPVSRNYQRQTVDFWKKYVAAHPMHALQD